MYEAIVIGVSAGGMEALTTIIPKLPEGFNLPLIVVQHRVRDADTFLAEYLNRLSALPVQEAVPGSGVESGVVYIAPSGYHLLLERDKVFSLSIDPRVNYSIPSVDVLFESAAVAYGNGLVGLILTGANSDGSRGLATVKAYGGLTLVQDPLTAEVRSMPQAAIAATIVDHILPLREIAAFLTDLATP